MKKSMPLVKLLVVTLSVSMLVSIFIQSSLIYTVASNEITKNVQTIAKQSLSNQVQNISQYFESIEKLAYLIKNNKTIEDYLSMPDTSDFYDLRVANQDSEMLLRQFAFSYEHIASIAIFTDYSSEFDAMPDIGFYANSFIEDPALLQALASEEDSGYIPPYEYTWMANFTKSPTFCYYEKVIEKNVHVATICIYISTDYFEDISNAGDGSNFFILSGEQTIFTSENEGIPLDAINDINLAQEKNYIDYQNNKYIPFAESLNNDWQVVNLVLSEEISSSSATIIQSLLVGIAVTFVLYMFFVVAISSFVTKSLKKLNRKMASTDFTAQPINEQIFIKEIAQLAQQYNIMELRIGKLTKQVRDEQKEIDKAQVDILQAQINPHFLYNTLDAINWMAIERDAEDISNMTSSLANLFRHSLNSGEETTSISNEIAHLTAYLEIQKYRYNNRFRFTSEIDERVLYCQTLNVILQPLVENCFAHGFRDNKDNINIFFSVAKHGGDIIYTIDDDGKGSDYKKLNAYVSNFKVKTNSYGIKSINRRISLYYGDKYGVEYMQKDTQGTRVQITIPFVNKEDGDKNEKT